MDKVAGLVEVDRTDDTHEVVITFPLSKPDASGLARIILQPRYARHLANVLIENAANAEAEAAGVLPEGENYRRNTRRSVKKSRELSKALF